MVVAVNQSPDSPFAENIPAAIQAADRGSSGHLNNRPAYVDSRRGVGQLHLFGTRLKWRVVFMFLFADRIFLFYGCGDAVVKCVLGRLRRVTSLRVRSCPADHSMTGQKSGTGLGIFGRRSAQDAINAGASSPTVFRLCTAVG